MTTKRPPRTDANGAAFAGSQLQTQLYVNKRTVALDNAIRAVLPGLADATFEWRSPLADENHREYWDAGFLKALGLEDHTDALARFWPTGGPHWDALARVTRPGADRPGAIIVEGKSYPDEMLKGSPATAKPASRRRIENALAWTQGQFGIDMNVTTWTGPLYQNANRLATLMWMRHRGIDAWLVHLLFTGDKRSPTTEGEWDEAIASADSTLGLEGVAVPWAAHAMLPAGSYEELTATTATPN